MAVLTAGAAETLKSEASPWLIAGQGAAALAAGMGIGRLVTHRFSP